MDAVLPYLCMIDPSDPAQLFGWLKSLEPAALTDWLRGLDRTLASLEARLDEIVPRDGLQEAVPGRGWPSVLP